MKHVSALALGLAAMLVMSAPAVARDNLHIVGSSTVYPFSTTVTEALAKQGALKSPVVEATGSVNGQFARIEYFGNAPNLVQGVVQISIRLPAPLPPLASGQAPGTAYVGLVLSPYNQGHPTFGGLIAVR